MADANYNITFVDGTLTIDPALLTVTANDSNKIYGTTNPAFTANFAGLTAGDVEGDYTVNFATAANANSNVGNYAVTPGGVADANYNITFVDGTLTIDPALLTVTANDSNKTYGTANPAFTANFAGLTAGDVEGDYTVNFATAANANSNVGNYAVTPGGMADANYNITFVDGTLTIDPALLTVTANDSNKIYGQG